MYIQQSVPNLKTPEVRTTLYNLLRAKALVVRTFDRILASFDDDTPSNPLCRTVRQEILFEYNTQLRRLGIDPFKDKSREALVKVVERLENTQDKIAALRTKKHLYKLLWNEDIYRQDVHEIKFTPLAAQVFLRTRSRKPKRNEDYDALTLIEDLVIIVKQGKEKTAQVGATICHERFHIVIAPLIGTVLPKTGIAKHVAKIGKKGIDALSANGELRVGSENPENSRTGIINHLYEELAAELPHRPREDVQKDQTNDLREAISDWRNSTSTAGADMNKALKFLKKHRLKNEVTAKLLLDEGTRVFSIWSNCLKAAELHSQEYDSPAQQDVLDLSRILKPSEYHHLSGYLDFHYKISVNQRAEQVESEMKISNEPSVDLQAQVA